MEVAEEGVRVDRGELLWWVDGGGWLGELAGGVLDVGRVGTHVQVLVGCWLPVCWCAFAFDGCIRLALSLSLSLSLSVCALGVRRGEGAR